VDSVRIVGVDRSHPAAQKLQARFRRRAVSPEQVAERILEAIERDRYLVFTSRDMHALFLLQRYFPPAYELVMRRLNRVAMAIARHAAEAPERES
jgi:hypothetical protein